MQIKKHRVSIRTKMLRLVLCAILLIAVVMGVSSVLVVNRLANEDAKHLLTQACEEESLRFDNKLNMVHHSVAMIDKYINDVNKDSRYELFSDEYNNRIKEYALSIAAQTDGAMSIYYRYNPELIGSGTGGFFWSKLSDKKGFVEEKPTDILAYNSSDTGRVGWYYITKESGSPMWMRPYYNQNLDVFMISYIIPIYSKAHDFLGVVGMDIDFNLIMDAADEVTLYDTGKLAFVDLKERLIYQVDKDGNSVSKKITNYLYNHITTINKASELLRVTEEDGSEHVICCKRLLNGMMIYVSVPVKEIYANRDILTMSIFAISVLILAITIIATKKFTDQLIEPVIILADITKKYANGNWDENYICYSGDEIQTLSESISIMAKNTQKYLSKVNNLARVDALTGVKNKTSYLEYLNIINENINHEYDKYAFIVLDLNFLKRANDNYGHEAGDILIKEASKYICNIFSHSPVFRIGGDEFVVILSSGDYENREALCERFENEMDYEVKAAHGIKLSISYGIASFPDEAEDSDELFKIADNRMYIKKKQMKQGRID